MISSADSSSGRKDARGLFHDNLPAIAALAVALLLVTIGWARFASRTDMRSMRAVAATTDVERIWGGPLLQPQPEIKWRRADAATVELAKGDLFRTDAAITLYAQYLRRGLTEYPGFEAAFDATYAFLNPSEADSFVGFSVGLPVQRDALMLRDLKLLVDGREDQGATEYSQERITWSGRVSRGKTAVFRLSYRARGLSTFGYAFRSHEGAARPVTAFKLALTVRGARGELDYPLGSMSPTARGPVEGGELLVWDVERLLTSFDIGVVVPDTRGVSAALSRLISNAPYFFVLFAGGLLYALPTPDGAHARSTLWGYRPHTFSTFPSRPISRLICPGPPPAQCRSPG